MTVNRVEFGGNVILDVSSDTVSANTLFEGQTAHGRDGSIVNGQFTIDTEISDQKASIEAVKQALQNKAKPAGKPEQEKTVFIDRNGQTVVTPDTGKVMSKVFVNVNIPSSGGNVEVSELVIPNLTPNFKSGNTGKISVWGWGETGGTWQDDHYIFLGNTHTPYIAGEETPMSVGLDASGRIAGLPNNDNLKSGRILVVKEVG